MATPQPHPLCRMPFTVDMPPSADEAARKVLLLGATEMALSALLCFTGQLQRGCSFGFTPTRDVQGEFCAELRAAPVTINQRACEATCTWVGTMGDRSGRWVLGGGRAGYWCPLCNRACVQLRVADTSAQGSECSLMETVSFWKGKEPCTALTPWAPTRETPSRREVQQVPCCSPCWTTR